MKLYHSEWTRTLRPTDRSVGFFNICGYGCVILCAIEGQVLIPSHIQRMASKIVKELKDRFTPHFLTTLHKQSTLLTILWVSFVCFAFGFGLGLLCLYSRILTLEQAIGVLAR
jgi:hypothetical protein